MKKYVWIVMMCAVWQYAWCVSLEDCRAMAIANNKQIKIADAKVVRAGFQRKSARAAYLPALDAEASYVYNQKSLALISDDAKLPTMQFDPATGKYEYNVVTLGDGKPLVVDGIPVPSEVAILPKSALTYDIHNVFAGAVSLTQPVYMGGKIRAMNKIVDYAEQIAVYERRMAEDDVVFAVDEAYWMVISLKSKEKLAWGYVTLLDTLKFNVEAMLVQGVATRTDVLGVMVKLNEANIDLVKVKNGLNLAQMQLAQLCGLPIDSILVLDDEIQQMKDAYLPTYLPEYDINDVYHRRNDVNALKLAIKVNEENAVIERASMLPQIAIVGAYSVTNPNSFDGFRNKFGGMFSVGASVKIPLWHWGGNYNKYKMAKSDVVIGNLTLHDAEEKIALQVRQASFQMQEAVKVFHSSMLNSESADANLRSAQLGFKEGLVAIDAVMAAQTAWLKANAETVDALIDVRLCEAKLKLLGVNK